MCHDCPHKREHEVGDEIALFPDYKNKAHPCHNKVAAPCHGHQIQRRKIALNLVQIEDYPTQVVYRT